MPTEWIVITRQVRVIDGEPPGVYELKTAHQATCHFIVTGERPCDCDFHLGELTYLHSLHGAN